MKNNFKKDNEITMKNLADTTKKSVKRAILPIIVPAVCLGVSAMGIGAAIVTEKKNALAFGAAGAVVNGIGLGLAIRDFNKAVERHEQAIEGRAILNGLVPNSMQIFNDVCKIAGAEIHAFAEEMDKKDEQEQVDEKPENN